MRSLLEGFKVDFSLLGKRIGCREKLTSTTSSMLHVNTVFARTSVPEHLCAAVIV